MKPRLLDLFCCAGGAARGYADAGFYVVGIDKDPQPDYPYDFIQGDAVEWAENTTYLDTFDAVHASPPCQAFSLATGYHPGARAEHPDLVDPIRQRLLKTGLPFVLENVLGAPLRKDLVLCGEMFGLGVHRHRLFEVHGFACMGIPHQRHKLTGAPTNSAQPDGYARLVAGNFADLPGASAAMGIDWMDRKHLAQAIPPAYTEFIGRQLMDHLTHRQELAA